MYHCYRFSVSYFLYCEFYIYIFMYFGLEFSIFSFQFERNPFKNSKAIVVMNHPSFYLSEKVYIALIF
jgi:hypothetical protein